MKFLNRSKSLAFSLSHLLLAVIMLSIYSCFPATEEKKEGVVLDFYEPAQQKIYDFQDRLMVDSLSNYFDHKVPVLRFLSALSFGSVGKDISGPYIEELVKLLKDERMEIRSAAAYSLGQIGNPRAESDLIKAFLRNDSLNLASGVNRAILEAVGKCGTKNSLKSLASVSTYNLKDTLLLEGQSLGIYRFGLRGITDSVGTKLMLKYVNNKNYPTSVRFIAANYLFRNRDINVSNAVQDLLNTYREEDDPRIRMSLAIALGRTNAPEVAQFLQSQYPREQDYRVKCNIIRALENFNYNEVKPTMTAALGSGNYHIATTAANFFQSKGISRDAVEYLQKGQSDSTLLEDVRFKLLGAANKHLSIAREGTRGRLVKLLETEYNKTNDVQRKIKLLDALGEFGWYYRIVYNLAEETNEPIIKSKITQILGKIISRPDFDTFFGLSRRRVKREIAEMLRTAIESGDGGAIAEASTILSNPALEMAQYYESKTFLTAAQIRLDLPMQIESFNAIQAAIDLFNGVSKPVVKTPRYNHPIVWEIFEEMGTNCQVTLNTSRGAITILLSSYSTPASCINFYQLAKSGYFDGKNFHRVVSNFVAQGGCSRGDGYGGLDYSIRSELGPSYYHEAGMVGMASAGSHTEGTQFFITHSPTPHLDGKYTLFGKVVDGLDIVHKIQPGDLIKSVNISK